jgi:hypothetical protein
MTDSESLTCASCGGELTDGSLECSECGNYPAFELRKAGAAVVFAGSIATQIYLYFGLVAIIVGLMMATTSVAVPIKASDYEFEFDI